MKKNLTFKLVQKWKRKLNEENSCKNNFEKVVKASKEKNLTCKWEQQQWERKVNEETNYENNSEEVVKGKKKTWLANWFNKSEKVDLL